MSITVTSTTDSPEAVLAAQGGAAEPKTEVTDTPAAEEIQSETLEASEPQDETDEPDGEEPGESLDKPKKKNGVQKRMSKLTRQREDARKEAEYWKQVALDKSAKPSDAPKEVARAQTDQTGRPNSADYETHELYVEALADWKVEDKLSKRDAATKELALKSEQNTKLKSFLAKREAFAKGRDDFFERMSDIGEIPMSITVNETLLEAENGPELLYELAKDVEEYKRICALPAIQAARELGKFEAKLLKADAKTEAKTTKAPKPPAPIGSGITTSTKSLADMDFQDYKKAREAGRTA